MKTIRVSAAVITDRNGSIFVTQRGYGEYKDYWEFPGGKIEPGETPEQALVREIREELTAVIEVREHLACIEYDYAAFHLSMECYHCTIKEGSPVLLEHEAARWVSLSDLPSIDFLPADKELVENVLLSGAFQAS